MSEICQICGEDEGDMFDREGITVCNYHRSMIDAGYSVADIQDKNYLVKVDGKTVASVSDYWFFRYAMAGQEEHIERLQAQNAALAAALSPFAYAYSNTDWSKASHSRLYFRAGPLLSMPASKMMGDWLERRHLKAAHAALQAGRAGESGEEA